MPPSADDLPGRKPPSRLQRRAAERTARKRGKQPGASGAAMSWAEPDEVVCHYPQRPLILIAGSRDGAGSDMMRSWY
jgi:hypothetical protein